MVQRFKKGERRWKWCRDLCPEVFDKLVSLYADERGVQLRTARVMLAINVKRLVSRT